MICVIEVGAQWVGVGGSEPPASTQTPKAYTGVLLALTVFVATSKSVQMTNNVWRPGHFGTPSSFPGNKCQQQGNPMP